MIGIVLGALGGLGAGYVSRGFADAWVWRRPDRLTWALAVAGALIVSIHPLAHADAPGPLVASGLVTLLLVIAASDIRERAVYPLIVYPAVLIAIALAPLLGVWQIDAIKGAVFTVALFSLLWLVARVVSGPGAFCAGDVSVAALMGAVAGLSRIEYALILLGVAGGLMGLGAAIKARSFRTAFPYAPALCIGAFAATMH